MDIKTCIHCKSKFSKGEKRSNPSWATAKYCSLKCFYISHKVWNKGNGEYAKKLGFGKWMLGKRQSVETRQKKSDAAKSVIARGEHNFYIDGRTTINHQIRNSMEYKLWRESVFKRDDYTCQDCGARCGNGKKVYLQADHIKPFAYYPELRFKLSNGRTLCIECHKKTDTYMGRALRFQIPSQL